MNLHTLPFVISDLNMVNKEPSPDREATLSQEPALGHEPVLSKNLDEVVTNNISESLILELKDELKAFSQSNTVLNNILISTSDGFEIASSLSFGSESHIRKIAALTSSLLSISSAMLKEMGGGEQNIVFMESNQNMIMFNRIPADKKMLCLMAVTNKDESTGQIFWRLRQLSEQVIRICNKHA